MSQPIYRYNFPTTVLFGAGARKKLPRQPQRGQGGTSVDCHGPWLG